MRTRPIGYHLRAQSELVEIQEKWKVSASDPHDISKTLFSRLIGVDIFVGMPAYGDTLSGERQKEKEETIEMARHVRSLMPNLSAPDRLLFISRLWQEEETDEVAQALAWVHGQYFVDIIGLVDLDLCGMIHDAERGRQPITPRRMSTPTIIVDDPYRPKVPQLQNVTNLTLLQSVHVQMAYWFRVLFWLNGLLSMMDETLARGHDDWLILDSGPKVFEDGESYWRIRGIVPTTEPANMSICSIDPSFFGPAYIPIIAGIPSHQDVETISSFKETHQRDRQRFLEHMLFLYGLIEEELVPQVDNQLEILQNRELRWLERNEQEPASVSYTDYEHLVYADFHTCRGDLFGRLRSEKNGWVVLCAAIYHVRVLAKYHKARLQNLLFMVSPMIGDLAKNSRPVVSISAAMACGDMFLLFGDTVIKEQLLDGLVRKATGLHKFVAKAACKVLVSIARRSPHIPLSKMVPLLVHRNLFIRCNAHRFLRLCMSILGNEGIVAYADLMASALKKSPLRTGLADRRKAREDRTLMKKPWHTKKQKSQFQLDEVSVF